MTIILGWQRTLWLLQATGFPRLWMAGNFTNHFSVHCCHLAQKASAFKDCWWRSRGAPIENNHITWPVISVIHTQVVSTFGIYICWNLCKNWSKNQVIYPENYIRMWLNLAVIVTGKVLLLFFLFSPWKSHSKWTLEMSNFEVLRSRHSFTCKKVNISCHHF